MRARLSVSLICAALLAAFGASPVAQTQTGSQRPAAPSRPAPPAPKAPTAAPKRNGQLVNVRIEFTITDQHAETSPAKRTISLIVADGEGGSVRSEPAAFQVPGVLQLNVDARPEIVSDGKIRLTFTFQYSAPAQGTVSGETPRGTVLTTNLKESLSLIVDDGKPLLVAQSADPTSDRVVSVEVKATIMK